MSLTSKEIELIHGSWAKVVPISDKAAELFYSKLFELDPELEALFPNDMEQQGKKLMTMIGTAVNALDRLGEIVPAVEALGERHVGYGVKDDDYDTVGQALIWTLAVGLDDAFTDEVKEAWLMVYAILANTMKGAAEKAAA